MQATLLLGRYTMTIIANVRCDFNKFLDDDEIMTGDLVDLMNYSVRINYNNLYISSAQVLIKVCQSQRSKYRFTGVSLKKKASYDNSYSDALIVSEIRRDLLLLKESGHSIMPLDLAVQSMKAATDNGESLVNWHNESIGQWIIDALVNNSSQHRVFLRHGFVYFGDTALSKRIRALGSIERDERMMHKLFIEHGSVDQSIKDNVWSNFIGKKIPCFI
jgi:hypothetical protein